jgi:hypothetical protein
VPNVVTICLAECERLGDPEMRDLVVALRTCTKSCREMVKAMGGHEHGHAGSRQSHLEVDLTRGLTGGHSSAAAGPAALIGPTEVDSLLEVT